MIVSELVALLGFRTDSSGAREFDSRLNALAERSNAVAAGMSAAFANAALNIAASLGHAIAGGLKAIPMAGDAMEGALTKIESSIGRSATSAAEAAVIYEKLYESSLRTGVGADSSATAFARFNLAMQELKRPASDTIKLIEGIQAAGMLAGTGSNELKSVTTQLAQGLASGVLSGDEFKSLRENMPSFLRDMAAGMGKTIKEVMELAKNQKLTPDIVVPAMLKASEKSMGELSKLPIGMGLSFKILSNSVTRFAADLDRVLGISRNIARAMVWIAQMVNGFRSALLVVGDFIRQLGGLRDLVQLLGIAFVVAFGIAPFLTLIKVVDALAIAFTRAFLPLAVFGVFVLAIEDFIAWMQGKNSFFGDFFGDFDTVIAPWKPKLEEMKSWFETNFNFGSLWENTKREFQNNYDFYVGIWEALKNFWNSTVEGMKPQFEWLKGAAGFLMEAWRPLTDFFVGVFDVILKNINGFYDRVVTAIGGIRGAMSSLLSLLPGFQSATESGGTGTDPERQLAGRKNFASRGALNNFVNPELASELSGMLGGLSPIPDVTGRVGTSTNTVNAPQSNNITNEITINAPAADPASIASGVNSGMGRATDNMTTRLGNSMALGLGISSPRIEAPAMP